MLEKGPGIYVILFDGPIQDGDYQKLRKLYEKLGKPPTEIALNSLGGSVEEAMRIGDFIEKENISATVPQYCASSCVLILAGGKYKTVNGRIGIHRPYLTDTSIKPSEISTLFPKLKESIKLYFERKGVSPQLSDDMFSIPPEQVKWLTPNELEKYRLNEENYVKEEQDDIKYANGLGISREEYLMRKKRMNEECAKYKYQYAEMDKCVSQIMFNK